MGPTFSVEQFRFLVSMVEFILPKMTSVGQPLDVSLKGPFNAALRECWADWVVKGPKERTSKSYRRRPSYQAFVNMVSMSALRLSQEAVRKNFRVCGIAADRVCVQDRTKRTSLAYLRGSANDRCDERGVGRGRKRTQIYCERSE